MDVKRPLHRLPRSEIRNPSFEDSASLALTRLQNIVKPDSENPPPLLFPSAEGTRGGLFTFDDWKEFGDLEAEHGRLTYTLARYPERGPPSTCEKAMRRLLSHKSVLAGWTTVVSNLREEAAAALEEVVTEQCHGAARQEGTRKAAYLTVPVNYRVSESTSQISLQVWKRSLEEVSMQLVEGCLMGAAEFLQVHAFLKDPIYGFHKPFQVQRLAFSQLLDAFHKTLPINSLSRKDLERVAAQAAQESSRLANPLMKHVFLIDFQAHHQLVYANVSLDTLSRAEFSVPRHVLEVVEEMLRAVKANNGRACPIIPILATTCPKFSRNNRLLTPIVDGNHRATATVLLRFLGHHPLEANRASMSQQLITYCTSHHLGKKWQIDLLDVLDELYQARSRRFYDCIRANQALVRRFTPVQEIPALVVQEEDFLTVCKQRSEGKSTPVLLHPLHQTLFNDDLLPFALPQKAGQTHGRPEAFRLLPLKPFGTGQAAAGFGADEVVAPESRPTDCGEVACANVESKPGRKEWMERTTVERSKSLHDP